MVGGRRADAARAAPPARRERGRRLRGQGPLGGAARGARPWGPPGRGARSAPGEAGQSGPRPCGGEKMEAGRQRGAARGGPGGGGGAGAARGAVGAVDAEPGLSLPLSASAQGVFYESKAAEADAIGAAFQN